MRKYILPLDSTSLFDRNQKVRLLDLFQQILHNVSVDIGQAEIPTLVPIGELCMIDAELVQNGGLKIVNMDGSWGEFFDARIDYLPIGVDDIVAKVIGISVNHAWFYSSTRHPDGVCPRMVVSTIVVCG